MGRKVVPLEGHSGLAPRGHDAGRRMHAVTSTGCLRVGTCPCKHAILLVEVSFFEPLILFTILANCGTMAWGSPLDPPGSWKARVLALCEQVFLVLLHCRARHQSPRLRPPILFPCSM